MLQEELVPTTTNATQLDRQLVVFSPNHGVKSVTTFHMSLHNVSDEIYRPPLLINVVQPILSLVSDFPNVRKIMAAPDDPVDLVLQEEMDSMQDLLLKSASAEVSFVEHDDVHDIYDVDIVVSDRERSPSSLPQLIDTQTAAQIDKSEVQTTLVYVHDDTEV